jgi:putative DNA primase/helicase
VAVSSADDVSPPAGLSSARDTAARTAGAAAASGLSLHQEALEDLRRSGLSDATITEAGLYTPSPGDLPRLLSSRLVGKVRHFLVFPYDGASHGGLWRREDEFVRCKLFPPVSDGQGHTIRYYQRAGTPPRLYIPARARAALADPSVPLLITEGEKKALKANQDGLTCVAIGGLWNWQVGRQPIADLDWIDWCDRETLIVPDSDVWTRLDLLQPVFAVGKELEGRGARVSVLKLPPGPDGTKVGLDDYLRVSSRDAFGALPRLPLKHAALGRASAWWREWVKRRDAESPEGEPTVLELLERGDDTVPPPGTRRR